MGVVEQRLRGVVVALQANYLEVELDPPDAATRLLCTRRTGPSRAPPDKCSIPGEEATCFHCQAVHA